MEKLDHLTTKKESIIELLNKYRYYLGKHIGNALSLGLKKLMQIVDCQ